VLYRPTGLTVPDPVPPWGRCRGGATIHALGLAEHHLSKAQPDGWPQAENMFSTTLDQKI